MGLQVNLTLDKSRALLFLFVGNLRRCLTQQADVRVQLYEVCFTCIIVYGTLKCHLLHRLSTNNIINST